MDRRADVVAQARLWLGTPYRHQASTLGAGRDCLGLVRGIWRGLHGAEPAQVPPYTPDWSEVAHEERLWDAARQYLRPAGGEWLPGQVLLFRMAPRAVAKHLGILSGPAQFIHAYCGQGVVESPLSSPWRVRVVARFEMI